MFEFLPEKKNIISISKKTFISEFLTFVFLFSFSALLIDSKIKTFKSKNGKH